MAEVYSSGSQSVADSTGNPGVERAPGRLYARRMVYAAPAAPHLGEAPMLVEPSTVDQLPGECVVFSQLS